MEGAFSVPDNFDQALPDDVQREFLTELWQKQRQTFENLAFYLECKQAKDENEFLNEAETQSFIRSLGRCGSKLARASLNLTEIVRRLL
jgi:hypothetical protein